MTATAAPASIAARRALPLLRLTRPIWLALGITAAVFAALEVSPLLVAAWVVPDLGVLAGGFRITDAAGGLRPGAVYGYNATHVLAGPVILGLLGVIVGHFAVAAAALWLSHIAIDRALGYWPRTVEAPARG